MSHYDAHGTPINEEGGMPGQFKIPMTFEFTDINTLFIPPSATHALVQTAVDALFSECPSRTSEFPFNEGFLFTRGSFRWLLGRTSIMNFRFREVTPGSSGSLIVQFYSGSIGPIPPMQVGGNGFK